MKNYTLYEMLDGIVAAELYGNSKPIMTVIHGR
jgi:hypothetical protein